MQQKRKFRNWFEKIIEQLLRFSGALTGITILLISFFLFKEGVGLFKTSAVEDGYGLFVHTNNPIQQLSPAQTKQIFDKEQTHWSAFTSKDDSITVFRIDEAVALFPSGSLGENYSLLPQKLDSLFQQNENIIAFLPEQFAPKGNASKKLNQGNIQWEDYFLDTAWLPTATPVPLLGTLPLVLGTLLVSIFALIIAVPLGLGVAIYLSELAGARQRKWMKPIIELLAGIPSVVYGFFGLVVLAPLVQKTFNLPVGETALTGSIILAIMALPTIISVAEDAMRNTPRAMREASLALGATHWQTIYKVVIPYAKSGISAAVVLGMGRAIGETMAVLMVTGNAAVMPHSLFESVRTIPATIAAELGEAPAGGAHYQALFLLGCILFVFTMIISISAELISKKNRVQSH